jgi:hypothetical protein
MVTAPERLAPPIRKRPRPQTRPLTADPECLRRARSVLIRRLRLRSDDFEATLALRIVERALAAAPHPDGPWRWQQQLNPRRTRAVRRRAARRRADPYRRPPAATRDAMR